MKYLYLVCWIFFTTALQAQSADELAIKRQLFQFQKAHNNGNIDSMMMIVSKNYQETFLPDVVYNVQELRQYYKSLIENPAYRSEISYNVDDVSIDRDMAITDISWEYFIYPKKGSDTLYYSMNKGVVNWSKENGLWKMKKAFGGNISEKNNISGHSTKTSIKTILMDWVAYFNSQNLEGVLEIYDDKVKGISAFNGSYITLQDLKKNYENTFNNKKLDIKYELDGMEELTISGNLAYSITVLVHKVTDKDQGITNKSKYREMTVWEQQDNGEWNIVSFVRKEIE